MSLFFNYYFLSPDIFLVVITLSLLIFGALISSKVSLGLPILTNLFYFMTFETFFFSFCLGVSQEPITAFLWNGFLIFNYFTFFAKVLLLFLAIFISSLTFPYLRLIKINFFEYWILILFGVTAVSLVIHAFDLLSIYITIEFQSLIFYVLASLNRTSEFSTEAGLKYFILGAFSSAFLLIGFAIIYNLSGISNLTDFSKLFSDFSDFDTTFTWGISLGILFILISLFFKFNVAPFHFWSPDVYEGIPISVTAFFATLPKLAIMGLIIKILYFSFYNFLSIIDSFLIICCFFSSVIGTLGAFLQTKWKRFIAYSSISHSSFILLGLLANDFVSLSSLFFFLLVYSITSILFFFIILNFSFLRFPKISYSRSILDSKNLMVNNSTLSIALLITMFSLAGIPPLAGFFSKFFILIAAVKNSFFGLTIIVIVLNCLASFYYLRFSKMMYFDFLNTHLFLLPLNFSNSVLISVLMLFLFLLFLDLDFFHAVSKLMAISLIK